MLDHLQDIYGDIRTAAPYELHTENLVTGKFKLYVSHSFERFLIGSQ